MEGTQIRRYTFKLYPNKAQTAALERQCALLAHLWNAALEERENQWRRELLKAKQDRKGLSFYDQSRALKIIRAEDPEYAAMSSATLGLCLKALDLAFQAFWRRLKEGKSYKEAGYPRFKSSAMHGTIWYRNGPSDEANLRGGGWKLMPHNNNWKMQLAGIPGTIRARGKFPASPKGCRTMEIMRRDGAWWASIVVDMPTRRKAGTNDIEIKFGLLDEFVQVKDRKNGQSLPGLAGNLTLPKERITPGVQRVELGSDPAGLQNGGDGRGACDRVFLFGGPAGPQNGGTVEKKKIEKKRLSRIKKDFVAQQDILEKLDVVQSTRDKRFKRGSNRWRKEKQRIARQSAKMARRRNYALHVWTTNIIKQAKDVTIVAPPVREYTKTARGTEKNHGAAVKPVALLNRNTLSQAPSTAIAMLKYKAEEAGVRVFEVEDTEPQIAIGRDLSRATKAVRIARRKLRKRVI